MIKDFVRKGEVIVTRGDIVWVKMGGNKIGSEQGGTRPAVVIQNDIGNKYSPTIIIAFITSQLGKHKMPTHVLLGKNEGLEKESIMLGEQIATIDKRRITGYIGRVQNEKMEEINNAIKISLGVRQIKIIDKQAEKLADKIKEVDAAIEVAIELKKSILDYTQLRAIRIGKLAKYCQDNRLNIKNYYNKEDSAKAVR